MPTICSLNCPAGRKSSPFPVSSCRPDWKGDMEYTVSFSRGTGGVLTVGANSQKIDSLSKSFRRSVNYPDGERRQSLSVPGIERD